MTYSHPAGVHVHRFWCRIYAASYPEKMRRYYSPRRVRLRLNLFLYASCENIRLLANFSGEREFARYMQAQQ